MTRKTRCKCGSFDCFYEKVIKVKADVAALHCLISVLVAFGTSGPPSLRLLLFYFSCSLWLSPHFHRKCCVRIAQERRRATRSTHSSPRFVCLPVKPCWFSCVLHRPPG